MRRRLGGMLNNGALTNLLRCTIIDNSNVLEGGALANSGYGATLNIRASSIVNNTSGKWGAGIYNFFGTVNIANSTLPGNRADTDGGGIYNRLGTVNATNVTVVHNTADENADGNGDGGGILQLGGHGESERKHRGGELRHARQLGTLGYSP